MSVVKAVMMVSGFCVVVGVALLARPRVQSAGAGQIPPSPPGVAATQHAQAAAPEARPGAYIQRLTALEASERWGDLAAAAFNDACEVGDDDRSAAIPWLEQRASCGRYPVLFCVALQRWCAGDRDGAVLWYHHATVVNTIDARRCTDATSRQAVNRVQEQLLPVRDYLLALPESRRAELVRLSLDFEESLAEREPAYWIAAHGIKSISAEAAGAPSDPASRFIPDDQWPEVRRSMRESLAARASSAAK